MTRRGIILQSLISCQFLKRLSIFTLCVVVTSSICTAGWGGGSEGGSLNTIDQIRFLASSVNELKTAIAELPKKAYFSTPEEQGNKAIVLLNNYERGIVDISTGVGEVYKRAQYLSTWMREQISRLQKDKELQDDGKRILISEWTRLLNDTERVVVSSGLLMKEFDVLLLDLRSHRKLAGELRFVGRNDLAEDITRRFLESFVSRTEKISAGFFQLKLPGT